MEYKQSERRPDGAETSSGTVRDPEDINSLIEGEDAAVREAEAAAATLDKEGKHAEARVQRDLMDQDFVKRRVISDYSSATPEEIIEAFRERNETFKEKLALFLEPVAHYETDGSDIDHESLKELNTTRKYLGLVWTELETLKWLAGNNNARAEFKFASGAGQVADTGREMPLDMQ